METPLPLKDIDFLLRRNWFLDEEMLLDLLYLADEDSWAWIIANRNRYEYSIKNVICSEAFVPRPRGKMAVRNMTDSEYSKIQMDAETESNIRTHERWIAYKEQHNICRPELDIDVQCQEVYTKIAEQRKKIKFLKTVPADTENKLRALENEFDSLKTRIQQEDKDWEYLTKTDLILNGTLSEMQKEGTRRSNM